MTPDIDPALERAYPYRPGWPVACCGVFFFGVMGTVAVVLLPLGYEQVRNGQLPVGVAMIVGGLFGMPMLFMAATSVAMAIRDAVRPPLLRVTPTALILPEGLRSNPEQDKADEAKKTAPIFHPEAIPFTAIRAVRRESKVNPGNDQLRIDHDLTPIALVVEQGMMHPADFDELETVLRAAIPAAFAPALPSA